MDGSSSSSSYWTLAMSSPYPNQPLYTTDLAGKTAIVIGENTGIGIETAKHFAKMNAERVIITCRNEEKGAIAVDTITGKRPDRAKSKLGHLN